MPLGCIGDVRTAPVDTGQRVAKMSLLSSSIGGGVRYHADEDVDNNMLQGKSRLCSRFACPEPRGGESILVNSSGSTRIVNRMSFFMSDEYRNVRS